MPLRRHTRVGADVPAQSSCGFCTAPDNTEPSDCAMAHAITHTHRYQYNTYAALRRRRMPTNPRRPVPRRTRDVGSGTALAGPESPNPGLKTSAEPGESSVMTGSMDAEHRLAPGFPQSAKVKSSTS